MIFFFNPTGDWSGAIIEKSNKLTGLNDWLTRAEKEKGIQNDSS